MTQIWAAVGTYLDGVPLPCPKLVIVREGPKPSTPDIPLLLERGYGATPSQVVIVKDDVHMAGCMERALLGQGRLSPRKDFMQLPPKVRIPGPGSGIHGLEDLCSRNLWSVLVHVQGVSLE